MNNLQNHVNSWIHSIQSVTRLSRDPSVGSASQEANFWLSMEAVLEKIEEDLRNDGVILSLDILKQAKRFHATVSFVSDTGLKEAMDTVQKYNQLFKDFPIDDLLSATSLDKLIESLQQLLSRFNKKLRVCPYPIRRALPLVESISRDLDAKLQTLISGRQLMHLDYTDFERTVSATNSIFQIWETELKEFTSVAREMSRRRSEKFIPIKVNSQHTKLQERVSYIAAFRSAHEQFENTITVVFGSDIGIGLGYGHLDNNEEVNALRDIRDAYALLKDVNVLDVTEDGTRIWVAAENTYNERVSRVENDIIARLRETLSLAKTAHEMFRVFRSFNALFVRSKIRSAIQEYQMQLIENVKSDINMLQERFKKQYSGTSAQAMTHLRDVPAISGAVLWVQQIARQLEMYMKRVEMVLGKDWELYAEGEKLRIESQTFRQKLNIKPVRS